MAAHPMTDDQLDVVVAKIQVLTLEPGDTIVLTCPMPLRREKADQLKGQLAEILGLGITNILVLDSGMDVKVLRDGEGRTRMRNWSDL